MNPVPCPSVFCRSLFLLSLLLALRIVPTRAEIIYDNSLAGGTNVYYSTLEYGDEVLLGGTGRIMTEFQFEYFGDFVATGVEVARLRVYSNDGPPTGAGADPTPGTVLYDSGSFPLSPGYQTKTFSGLNITIPVDVTWTVQFNGFVGGNGDEAGLIFRTPPTVGSSFDDFWLKTAGGWQLFSWNGSPVANFAARISSGITANSVTIRRDTSNVVIEWPGASILQVSPNVAGPFTDIPAARNKYQFDARTAASMYWRLRD